MAEPKSLKNNPMLTSMQTDAADFSRELNRLAEFAFLNYEAIVTKTIMDLFYNIVVRTPIDTGMAKSKWFIDIDPDNEPGAFDQDSFDQFKYDPEKAFVIWIYNNLEYIIPLEEGSSDQAPQGMVGLSLIEFENYLKEAIRKLSDMAEPA